MSFERTFVDFSVFEGDTIHPGFETREKAERYGHLVQRAHPGERVRIASVEHTERVSSVRDLPAVTS